MIMAFDKNHRYDHGFRVSGTLFLILRLFSYSKYERDEKDRY